MRPSCEIEPPMALPDWITRLTIRRFQQVDLGQPAVATEDEGVAAVARIDRRGVRQVTEAADAGIGLAAAGIDQRHVAARPAR